MHLGPLHCGARIEAADWLAVHKRKVDAQALRAEACARAPGLDGCL